MWALFTLAPTVYGPLTSQEEAPMLRRVRCRLTYANVVSTLGVFIALGGVSYAAVKLPKNSVGSKQIKKNAVTGSRVKNSSLTGADIKNSSLRGGDIKNSSLTGADIKNRSLTAADFNGSVQGPAGPQGAAGAAGAKGDPGAKGDTGARGFSAWNTIPSGTTVTGSNVFDLHSPAAGSDFSFSVPLPGKAPQPLDNSHVNFAPDGYAATDDDDATCTGTVSAPTAPAGKVCLYAALVASNADPVRGNSSNLADSGFRLYWIAPSTGDTFIQFNWAYTAP